MKYVCLVVYNNEIVVKASNKILEPLSYLCELECIRFKIQSRTSYDRSLRSCGRGRCLGTV